MANAGIWHRAMHICCRRHYLKPSGPMDCQLHSVLARFATPASLPALPSRAGAKSQRHGLFHSLEAETTAMWLHRCHAVSLALNWQYERHQCPYLQLRARRLSVQRKEETREATRPRLPLRESHPHPGQASQTVCARPAPPAVGLSSLEWCQASRPLSWLRARVLW